MNNAIGIDIGGTKIAGGVVSPTGELLHQVEMPTDPESPESILSTIGEIVSVLPLDNTQSTIGVAVAAFLDSEREKIYFSPNIVWEDYPLAQQLEGTLARPVVIENDANAAGWAEYRFGAAVDSESMMMLTMGTGVGGAVVDHGRLLVGGFGSAGELGHIIIRPGGLLCGCGNRGCLEQYASGTALMRDARVALDNPELTTDELTLLLEAGDKQAMGVFREVCDAMGFGIASLVAVTDPDTVVIGGGVARAGSVLAQLITESFRTHYGSTNRKPTAQIVVATLGNTAGMIGAADLARERRGIGT